MIALYMMEGPVVARPGRVLMEAKVVLLDVYRKQRDREAARAIRRAERELAAVKLAVAA